MRTLLLLVPALAMLAVLPTSSIADEPAAEIARLKAEIEPLAQFYLDETRSHLRWSVRIVPVRRTKGGEVDLRGLLEAVDRTGLAAVAKAITEQDSASFAAGYRQTLEGCYTCHKAAEKPYLRPRVPEMPEARIINFDPAATWP